jgi:DNA helicase-2/ATP-dependent DNA helicase PcrA
VLGRGVVVRAGDPVPSRWAQAGVIVVDEGAIAAPAVVVGALHDAWSQRVPTVVSLAVDADHFRAPISVSVAPWELDPNFELWWDRLHFLVWANTYDARGGMEPVWWWGRKASRLGAEVITDGRGDVVLADGTPAWIDGGPRGPVEVDGCVVHRESIDLGTLNIEPIASELRAALAPDQLAAVQHGAGPARIVAPAGSGKTRVLTERLRRLIVDLGFQRETTLAVAYNKKAQLELEERCAAFRPRATTLNALGHALLGGRRVLDEREVRDIVEGLVPKPPRRANVDPLAPYLEGLSTIRLGLRDPDDVEAERDDVPGLAAAFVPFRRALATAGAVDFDEQIYGAIERLLRDGEARRRAQVAHRHLLVDELQDLTPAHVLLLRLLATPELDVFGVGDDDQVIYGHAGADPSFLIGFATLFPGAASHPLEVNYRCPVAVVDAARTLLSYNYRRVAKEMRPGPAADPAADALVVHAHAAEAGARDLVTVVEKWIAAGVAPTEIAVLARVNSLLLAPHVALMKAGIAVQSAVSGAVLERTGVRAALAYLRLGASPANMQPGDLQEVLRRPSRGFPNWIGKWLQRSMSLSDLRAIADRLDDVKVGAKVASLADDLAVVADAVASGSTRQALTIIRDDVGLGGAMSLLDGSKGGQSGSQLDDLEALIQVADLHPEPVSFETWLRDALATRSQGLDGVTVSTVHRVKGMEWDRVAVVAVTGGVVPHRLAEDEEEERRVLHVAITRARHQVVVLTDRSRPSSFLAELDGTAPRRAAERRASPEQVTIRGRKATLTPAPDLAPDAARADDALRAWRLERCRADEVAAFIICSNAVLRSIAIRRPTTLAELAAIDGIGPTKLDLYGDEILAVLDSLD